MSVSVRTIAVKVAIVTVLAVSLASCRSPFLLTATQKEYMECFRLDREPFEGELDTRCTDPSARSPKTGTYHRDPTEELRADIVPVSMAAELAGKLPVSDCLWAASSGSGAGDRLAPLWEATLDLDMSGDGVGGWHVASCRFDPPYPRVSVTDPDVRTGCWDLGGPVLLTEPTRLGDIKSTCDYNNLVFTGPVELKRQPPRPSRYGECGLYDNQRLTIANFPTPASTCATVNVLGDGEVTFDSTLLPHQDGLYIVDSAIDKALSPGIRTVMGARSIARLLSADSAPATWQTTILIDGEPGQQRWRENFTDAVRVERARVFSVTDPATDDRRYVSLDGATLVIDDPDATSGAATNCAGMGESFDLLSCQIDVTPTYRPANLERSDVPVLTAPLIWSIDSDAIEDNGRQFYIEFDLISTYDSRQAALMAEVPTAVFGGITVGDYDHTMIRFSNVGTGHFVIDSVMIGPQSAQPSAFLVERLDDPVMVPHPLHLDETANPDEKIVGIESWAAESPLYELQVMENGTRLSRPFLHESGLELFGEPVLFAGNTAVAQSAQPIFPGYVMSPGRTYPFKFPVYRRWSLPYTLAPGQSRTVQVMARPNQPGALKAQLVVSGYPLHDPGVRQNVEVPLSVTGMTGPQVDHMPIVMRFPLGSNSISTLNAIVVSYGDMDLTRGDVTLVDSIDGMHSGESQYFSIDGNAAPAQTIPPGSSELIPITYDPGCFYQMPADGEHVAVLRIDTDAGVREIALRGDPARWSASTPGCHAGP